MTTNKTLTAAEQHVNPYEKAVKDHVPAAGDVYAYKNPNFNGAAIIRLVSVNEHRLWTCVDAVTGDPFRNVSDNDLRSYYRWISNDFADTLSLADRISKGSLSPSKAAALITDGQDIPADTEALMATASPEHIATLLDASERMQNRLAEVNHVALCLIEQRKHELNMLVRSMDEQLRTLKEKVGNILKVITVLNLYTGRTVDVNVIAEGEPAPADEPLSLRQRILFMDEEICVHLDHEADYSDVPAFFEWLKDPQNRDIIAPEPRCVVCLKPKRFDMDYRSGDPRYDAARNIWNKHTYVVIRNGENLFWLESEDLEVWNWAFPHEDFYESYAKQMAGEGGWKDQIQREYDAVNYRVTKYMMFLQGLIDQRQDIIGSTAERINLMKLSGVRLVRDDENLLGTGRKPWAEFRKEKNGLIRRGTRILYVADRKRWDVSRRQYDTNSGDYLKSYRYARPEFPATGLYHADEAEVVVGYDHGNRVTRKNEHFVFRYLPGDTVWNHTEGEHDRKQRISWVYEDNYVLNYDAVSLEDLQGYLEDRTMRQEFASMIPILVKMKFLKVAELEDERLFKDMLRSDIVRETGREPDEGVMDAALGWWKGRVIFTRALRSDDAKAFRMIRAKVLSNF